MAGARQAALLLLALAALSGIQCSETQLASDLNKKAEGEQLDAFNRARDWMLGLFKRFHNVTADHHYSFNVELGYNKDGVRGIFTTKDVKAGDVVVTFPAASVMNVGGAGGDDMEPTLRLLQEIKRGDKSHFKPYIDTLPKSGEAVNYCNFPPEYYPLLQSEYHSYMLGHYQERLRQVLGRRDVDSATLLIDEVSGGEPVTMEELRHVCAVLGTHFLSMAPRPANAMIPIFDLANHRDKCEFTVSGYRYQGDWDLDLHFIAQEDVPAGRELCYRYGEHREEHWLIFYGFVLRTPVEGPRQLYLTDHFSMATFDPEVGVAEWIIDVGPDVSEDPEATPEQAAAEVERLRKRLEWLDEGAAELEAKPVQPAKGFEWMPQEIKVFQARRRAAIRSEISKLQTRFPGVINPAPKTEL